MDAHPLFDALAAAPDDPAPWAVYADVLQASDHPRGELIALMMERERRPSARLLEAQRKHFTAHKSVLVPATPGVVLAWRRGFASELRLVTPAELAEVARDPALRFVQTATLVIDVEHWDAWRTALAAVRMPWRRLHVQLAGKRIKIEMAVVFACAPAMQRLRVEGGTWLSWKNASGPELVELAIVNGGKVSIDDAELPRLEELRLLGESVATKKLRTSLRWSRLKRVVLAQADEDIAQETGPQIVVMPNRDEPDIDDDEYDEPPTRPRTTAFLVVGADVQPSLLAKLATRMSVSQLSARVVTMRWLPRPTTVVQLFGSGETELMPYGLGIALENVIDPAPPIALVEIDEDRAARFLVLGVTQTRGTRQGPPGDVVQRALDLALGFDPGSKILQDICDELAAAPLHDLLGKGGGSQLTMIDPATAPLFTPDDDDYGDDDDDDDSDEDEEYDEEDGLEASYEEPPPPPDADEPVEETPVTYVSAEIANIVAATHDGEPTEEPEDEPVLAARETEDALEVPPERVEQWLELYDHWDDRAVAVDDEPHEVRWPDPEMVANELPHDLDRRIAAPACAHHGLALVECRGCDVFHCAGCDGEDWCATCFARVVEQTLAELPAKRGAG